MEEKLYCWSNSIFDKFSHERFKTEQEALEKALLHTENKDFGVNNIYVGKFSVHEIVFPVFEDLTEIMSRHAHDDTCFGGDCVCDDWLAPSLFQNNKEKVKVFDEKLKSLVQEFINEFGEQPTFGAIKDIKKYDWTSGKLKDYYHETVNS